MKIFETSLSGLLIYEGTQFSDTRGTFSELYNKKNWIKDNQVDWVQDNLSISEETGTLRGLHIQYGAASQGKLLSCLNGEIFDVCVDARIGSETYGKFECFHLNGDSNSSIYIPRGFLHGFLTLSKTSYVYYKVDNYYDFGSEITVKWNDPTLQIPWPKKNIPIIISDKDKLGISFKSLKSGVCYDA